MEHVLPQRLFLLGGGHHPSTRIQRRKNRVTRRVIRIGDLTIRPGRRVDVTPEFVAKHLVEISAAVRAGTLIVQHSADRFVNPEELAAIAAVVRGETPEGPLVQLDDNDPIDNPDDEGDNAEALVAPGNSPPAVEEEPTEAPMEPEEAQEESWDDSDLPDFSQGVEGLEGDQPAEEAQEAQSLDPATQNDEVWVSSEDTDFAEPEVERRWLPEGFEKLTKKELIALAEERKISLEGKRVNVETLIRLLKAWRG